jgi:acetate kinase
VPVVLALNPGSNSLKFDIMNVNPRQGVASAGKKLLGGNIDDIGKKTRLAFLREGRVIATEAGKFGDFHEATNHVLHSLKTGQFHEGPKLADVDMVAVRVVHGGNAFTSAVLLDSRVRKEILSREELAPLHNKSSLEIIDAVRKQAPKLPIFVAFDTAFHHTLPEHAWRYPIARKVTDHYGIRKFGFHGLSHRYLLERYAELTGKSANQVSAVTLHLEGGSSASAIKKGKSIDTSMGFTPLEGLMMGSRCGNIDAAIVPFLIRHARMSPDKVMHILEKESGLVGISGKSMDTRILRTKTDKYSKLALKMFAYRVLCQVGSYLAVLGETDALIFGGGIGENTPEVRRAICDGLEAFGLTILPNVQSRTRSGDVRISRENSKLAAWVIHSEETLQLAHECVHAQRAHAERSR